MSRGSTLGILLLQNSIPLGNLFTRCILDVSMMFDAIKAIAIVADGFKYSSLVSKIKRPLTWSKLPEMRTAPSLERLDLGVALIAATDSIDPQIYHRTSSKTISSTVPQMGKTSSTSNVILYPAASNKISPRMRWLSQSKQSCLRSTKCWIRSLEYWIDLEDTEFENFPSKQLWQGCSMRQSSITARYHEFLHAIWQYLISGFFTSATWKLSRQISSFTN